MNYKIVFVSTNGIYSGSEVLMLKTAKIMSEFSEVYMFTKYNNYFLNYDETSNVNFVSPSKSNSFFRKVKNRLLKISNDLKLNLIKIKPNIVVISQGSPIASLNEIEICIQLNLKFIVINQLVSDYHWSQLSDNLFLRLKVAYHKSNALFFVSKQNEELFKVFFGDNLISKQINNPVTLNFDTYLPFPEVKKYKIAFVGRIYFYHKGLDLLIEVLRNPIWNTRNVEFNFYGSGPHEQILLNLIKIYGLDFCSVKGHTNNLIDVWSENHIAIFPSRFEGKSLAISEAMSIGRAVIATNVGGVNEQIENNVSGFICNHFSIDSFSETLERAWDSRELWNEIGVNARKKFLKDNQILPQNILSNFIEEIIRIN